MGGLRVEVEHVLHIRQIFAGYRADAPHGFLPGFALAFFKTRRMDSSKIFSTYCNSTSFSLNCSVHCTVPAGESLQATLVIWASRRSVTPGKFLQSSRQPAFEIAPLDAVKMIWVYPNLRLNFDPIFAFVQQQKQPGPNNFAAFIGSRFSEGQEGGLLNCCERNQLCFACHIKV